MPSIKLSITCRSRLKAKYDSGALTRIDAAVAKWVAADKARGITTIHLAIDDAAAMKPYKVAAVTGTITPAKVEKALDALVTKLKPDYIVLFGATDVVPAFSVTNPTASEDGEPKVPTDNPYASSQKFVNSKRATYLIPDRVVGRIPDLPGSGDPAWLIDYLAVATKWKSGPRKTYAKSLLVCCDTWKASGRECVSFIAGDPNSMMICPPSGDASKNVTSSHSALLHMIKCHGSEADSQFYGQKGSSYPTVLRSTSLLKRTKEGTVTGAMCCYGASVFDPAGAISVTPGEPPIPSVYLRQGAYGFLGSTNTAWVGDQTMMCADWVVASFLKAILGGASLGRATLETKQDFMRWTQQQGDEADAADEKTMLQFVLLGDPSIHPVQAVSPSGLVSASLLGAKPTPAAAMARAKRRSVRLELGAMLRAALPQIEAVRKGKIPDEVRRAARALVQGMTKGNGFDLASPRVQRVVSTLPKPASGLVAAGLRAMRGGPPVERSNLQYYWSARKKAERVNDIRLVSVQADNAGNVLRTQVLVSS